jgi:hypothetical protein
MSQAKLSLIILEAVLNGIRPSFVRKLTSWHPGILTQEQTEQLIQDGRNLRNLTS